MRTWTTAEMIAYYAQWLRASKTSRPLPVPSTPLGLRRSGR